MITTILLVAALVFFLLTAFNVPQPGWLNYVGAGLACFVAAQLVPLIK